MVAAASAYSVPAHPATAYVAPASHVYETPAAPVYAVSHDYVAPVIEAYATHKTAPVSIVIGEVN